MISSVFLYPVEGSFDVASIEQYLAQREDVLLDPVGSGIYLICGLPEAKEGFREERLEDPSRFPYAVLVTVKPDVVNVYQEYGDEYRLRSARDFVRWMVEHHRPRITDDYGNDVTERIAKEGVGVLYPAQLA